MTEPTEVLLVDGQVKVWIGQASAHELLASIARLHRMMVYAAFEVSKEIQDEHHNYDSRKPTG